MVVSLEALDWFWCFNFWLKALNVYFHPGLTAGPSDPHNWRSTAAASCGQHCRFLFKTVDLWSYINASRLGLQLQVLSLIALNRWLYSLNIPFKFERLDEQANSMAIVLHHRFTCEATIPNPKILLLQIVNVGNCTTGKMMKDGRLGMVANWKWLLDIYYCFTGMRPALSNSKFNDILLQCFNRNLTIVVSKGCWQSKGALN